MYMPSILPRLVCAWNCFLGANFRTHKGGVKIHTLYDVETQVPVFIHITEAKINDVRAMDVIPYEYGSFYVFDRAYNDYHRLYKIHMMDSFFVVLAKTNIKARVLKWKRRLPKNIMSDCEIELFCFYTQKSYPETIRLVMFWGWRKRTGVHLSDKCKTYSSHTGRGTLQESLASGTVL